MERAAALCERARRAADRRHPALRRRPQRRSPRPPRALPARLRGRRPARRARLGRAALGQSALRLAGAARQGYRWWIERLRRAAELADLARIDHFRGFVAYWSIPARSRSARAGRWRRGPGAAVFDAARRELGELAVIAEDLGVITPPVERLRLELGFPGMAVLIFGFARQARQSAPAREPHRAARRLHRHARHAHGASAGGTRSMPGRRRRPGSIPPSRTGR